MLNYPHGGMRERNFFWKDKADKEYGDYVQEDFKIDVLESNREEIYGTKELLLSIDKEFNGVEAVIYEVICSAFENINK